MTQRALLKKMTGGSDAISHFEGGPAQKQATFSASDRDISTNEADFSPFKMLLCA